MYLCASADVDVDNFLHKALFVNDNISSLFKSYIKRGLFSLRVANKCKCKCTKDQGIVVETMFQKHTQGEACSPCGLRTNPK